MKNLKKIFSPTTLSIDSAENMRKLGNALAEYVQEGDVIGLVGDLGSGKTHLTQGIIQGLGTKEPIVSPTFSLVHEYEDTKIPCAHFDFYRMESPEEAISLGWDDFINSKRVLIVEWADRFDGELMPDDTIWIHIKYNDSYGRNVTLLSV